MQSESSLFHGPADLNNFEVTEIKDMHENRKPLDVTYLTSPW